jgi:selenocysteine-specific translation elongation factor
LGTVFAGKVVTGGIAAGDRIVCRTPSTQVAVRVISVQDVTGRAIKRGETGATVGVVCKTIDLSSLGTAPDGSGVLKVPGVRLVSAPEKKHWWQ